MKTGKVKFFDESKGFGFITDNESGQDYFVHVTKLDGQEIREGDEVSFEIKDTPRGPNAVNITLI